MGNTIVTMSVTMSQAQALLMAKGAGSRTKKAKGVSVCAGGKCCTSALGMIRPNMVDHILFQASTMIDITSTG